MVLAANLGYPRLGAQRELKRALEGYWAGKLSLEQLRQGAWDEYLKWAVDCFRLAVARVSDETQIHTHLCYGEFNDILQAIGRMDADVISIEASRSKMELLGGFARYKYPNAIGPGVYDIHSPRVPSVDEMETLIKAAGKQLKHEQLWMNPDCGLKTRS